MKASTKVKKFVTTVLPIVRHHDIDSYLNLYVNPIMSAYLEECDDDDDEFYTVSLRYIAQQVDFMVGEILANDTEDCTMACAEFLKKIKRPTSAEIDECWDVHTNLIDRGHDILVVFE